MKKRTQNPKNIVIVEFSAYDKHDLEEHFFDKTAEQCTAYIFKHICNTAVIHHITEYIIQSSNPIVEFKKKQTDKELFKDKDRAESKSAD